MAYSAPTASPSLRPRPIPASGSYRENAAFRSAALSQPQAARIRRPLPRAIVRAAADGGAKARGEGGLDVEGNGPTTPKAWQIMSQTLAEKATFVTPDQLLAAVGAGRPVLDVRPASEFGEGFIMGSVNVPLYRPIQGWDGRSIARRVGFALFGVLNGTEVNDLFWEEVREAIPDEESRPIVVCSMGGSLEGTAEKTGMQSRSLIAAYELIKMGYRGVAVLKGGISNWVNEERDLMVYAEEEGDADGE